MLPRNTHKFLPDVNSALDDPSLLEIIEGVSNFQHQDVEMKKSMDRMLCLGRCRWEDEECARSNLRLTGGSVKRWALPRTFRFVGVFSSYYYSTICYSRRKPFYRNGITLEHSMARETSLSSSRFVFSFNSNWTSVSDIVICIQSANWHLRRFLHRLSSAF